MFNDGTNKNKCCSLHSIFKSKFLKQIIQIYDTEVRPFRSSYNPISGKTVFI